MDYSATARKDGAINGHTVHPLLALQHHEQALVWAIKKAET